MTLLLYGYQDEFSANRGGCEGDRCDAQGGDLDAVHFVICSAKIPSRILFLARPVCALPALVLWSKLPDDEIAQFLAIALR
ncbi:MAG: hypothetical protein AAF283_04570 [Cyanobacteria bacterium P01_A01_bin.70]